MFKYFVKINFLLLISILLFQGCAQQEKYTSMTISKEENLSLDFLSDILAKHNFSIDSQSDFVRNRLEINETTNINELRIAFSIKEGLEGVHLYAMDFCDSNLSYSDARSYPGYMQGIGIIYPTYAIKNFYYKIETLKEKGYFANNPIEQKDLCVFARYRQSDGLATVYQYNSNTLIYSAEEINKIVQQYEEMQ